VRRPAVWLLPAVASLAYRWYTANGLAGTDGLLHATPEIYVGALRFPTLAMLDGLAIGLFLAATQGTWSSWPQTVRRAIGVAGAVLLIAGPMQLPEFPTVPWQVAFLYSALAVAFGALLVAAEGRGETPRGWSFITKLALWSYGAYLWHFLLVRALDRAALPLPWPVHIGLYLAATLGLSALTYVAIERPGMRLRRFVEKATPPATKEEQRAA
jgi:peptidoglycan/LPS O-acetylase OafA/YrhL